jgi:hypothetical protein
MQVFQSEELLTVSELAVRLKVKRSWVYSHSGDLGALHLGKYIRFEWERVLQRLAKGVPIETHAGSATRRPPAIDRTQSS